MVTKEIESIKNTILVFFAERKLPVNNIILFGSYINENRNENSDIDLIIISDFFEGKDLFEKAKLTDGLEWQLVKKFKKPFDILYYSKNEWDYSDYLIINEAKKYGEMLYT